MCHRKQSNKQAQSVPSVETVLTLDMAHAVHDAIESDASDRLCEWVDRVGAVKDDGLGEYHFHVLLNGGEFVRVSFRFAANLRDVNS
jgi:hypothetical protein